MEEVDVAVEYIRDQSGNGCVHSWVWGCVFTAGYRVVCSQLDMGLCVHSWVWGCVFTAGYEVVCSQLGMGLCVHSWVWGCVFTAGYGIGYGVDRWSYL